MTTRQGSLKDSFGTGFGGTLVAPGDPGYDEARIVWNGTVDTRPAVIARCRTTADVVEAVNVTRAAGVSLAVRAGGHSVAGFSSCDGGVVIDLTGMRGVSVDPVPGSRSPSPERPGPTTTRPPRPTDWRAPAASSRRRGSPG